MVMVLKQFLLDISAENNTPAITTSYAAETNQYNTKRCYNRQGNNNCFVIAHAVNATFNAKYNSAATTNEITADNATAYGANVN